MRKSVELIELSTHARCPEQERRRKGDPNAGISALERRYRTQMRRILVRIYTEMLSETPMSEAQVRRSWSTMWHDIPLQPIGSRTFAKGSSSTLNGLMTDPERLLLRGAATLHRILARKMHATIKPVIVDEPFTLQLGDVCVVGKFDLAFEDSNRRYWIVDWTDYDYKYEFQHDIRHAALMAAFFQVTGRHAAGVLVDYAATLGDIIEISLRTPEALADQIEDAKQICRALSAEIVYKSIGLQCNRCPYKASCRGIKVVQQKRPKGRPRKRIYADGPEESL